MADKKCLEKWLQYSYGLLYGDESTSSSTFLYSAGKKDFLKRILVLGKKIFSLSSCATMNCLEKEIQFYFGSDLHLNDDDALIEIFLIFCVSENCEHRSLFLEQILELNEDLQTQLMLIIKHTTYTILPKENCMASSQSPMYNAAHTPKNNLDIFCLACESKDGTIASLRKELSDQISSEQERERNLKDNLLLEVNKTVDVELTLLQKEEIIREKEKTISELERKVYDAEQKAAGFSLTARKVSELQDEIDVLKPQAERLLTVESQVEKLRARLEELQDAKQQLSAETASHAKTYSRMVSLEGEVESLKKNRQLVEQYRDQLAELVIERDDLARRLQTTEKETEELRGLNSSLSTGQQQRLEESRNLSGELIALQEQLREVQCGSSRGIGEGLTELNPAVRQEVDKLRSENKLLHERLLQTAPERVQQMEAHIEDQKLIIASLQTKWADTRSQLTEAGRNIISRDADILHLRSEIDKVNTNLQQVVDQAARDTDALTAAHLRQIGKAEKQWRSVLTFHRISALLTERELCTQVEKGQQDLQNSDASLKATTEERNQLQEHVATLTADLQEATETQQRVVAEYEMTIKASAEEQREQCKQLQATFETKQQALQQSFQSTLATEGARLSQAVSDLEEEGMRRRKAERGKKFLEVEVQRLKTQVQSTAAAGGGGSNGCDIATSRDIDVVIKELKSMQQELNEANKEISFLRSRGNCNLVDGRDGALASAATGEPCRNENVSIGRGNNSSIVNSHSSGANSTMSASTSLKGPSRVLRPHHGAATSSWADAEGDDQQQLSSLPQSQGFLEQAELSDKRIDQLTKEKREMISKTLEENKEKMELTQKLLVSEKEVTTLRTELRKAMLEKERAERKLLKQNSSLGLSENMAPALPSSRLFSQI